MDRHAADIPQMMRPLAQSLPRLGAKALDGAVRLLCFFLACGLLIVTVDQVQRYAAGHGGAAVYLLPLVLVVPAGILGLAAGYLLEASLIGWPRSSLKALRHPSASVRLDALCMLFAQLPYKLPGYLLSLGLLLVADRHFVHLGRISVTRFVPTWGLQAASLLLLQSLASYWIHRWQHTIPALWALHQLHHSADRMSVMTAVRETELAKGVELALLLIFLALSSDPVTSRPGAQSPLFFIVPIYFAYRSFIRVNQYLVHSNLTTGYGWIGRWLLVSPRMHRLHHAADPRYHNKNFTFDLVIWDRLFGSYANCDGETVARLPLGLENSPFNTGPALRQIFRDYLFTYVLFWRALRRGRDAWRPMPTMERIRSR